MALPPQLKPIQHHIRTAQEHEKRDPVVAYYCRLFAVQSGMKLDSKSPECRKFLVRLMDQLEAMKKEMSDNDSITQDVVGNAHIENYALKLFMYADNEDRAGHFHKNMIKSFFTASLLLDVLSVFGELSEENVQQRKYARWKATYIHQCLKNGETPQSGPMALEQLDEAAAGEDDEPGFSRGGSFSGPPLDPNPAPIGFNPAPDSSNINSIHVQPGAHAPANTPADLHPPPAAKPVPTPRTATNLAPSSPDPQPGGFQLTPEDFTQAQKYCKYAGSALQYEDVNTAVQNLQKALRLLTTGRE
ncbi:vacuolar protein sorting-associated protein VTA1 homolog isoform X2 [Synchiropus splendidus]|uniref:vacuolar protein sorting-associated protein VTA1 homolog isoform X2 n=1 Tax=Synchiropus splendidus TaxID=270530 RepID=UPI00237ED514|nr:vacuolar protein sorting-associated protein VTA1 homolog isoform X2 [Synchiropus splendidus]